jgi:exodeoxyribonuclease-3
MKLATWNVNSLRVRLPQVIDWLAREQPDVLCLQETKVTDAEFPDEALRAAGYHAAFTGQKTYNGVATLCRQPPSETETRLPGDGDEAQKRLIAVTAAGVRIINVYVPNGESVDSDKYRYKLDWLSRLRDFVAGELKKGAEVILTGDYNIAPEPRDVHDPAAWQGQVLFSEPERAAFRALIESGLIDTFRRFDQPTASFTWWDYRMNGFKRNLGLRIAHILTSAALAGRCRSCRIDVEPRRAERPSDHAPVVAEFS